jgi:hypothetical protein
MREQKQVIEIEATIGEGLNGQVQKKAARIAESKERWISQDGGL